MMSGGECAISGAEKLVNLDIWRMTATWQVGSLVVASC